MRIGLVEDERLEREAVKLLLSRVQPPVEVVFEAASGEDAVKLCRLHHPDLMMMDIQLPRGSGLEAAKMIRNTDEQVEIVILTAFSDFNYARESLAVGAFDYLLKPLSPEKLYDVIARVRRRLSSRGTENMKRRAQEQMLEDIDRYIKKEMVYYMIVGNQLDVWETEFFQEYLHMRGYGLRCVLFHFQESKLHSEPDGGQVRKAVEAANSAMACRVYLQEIACIIFEKMEVPAKEPYTLPREALALLPGLCAEDVDCYQSGLLSDFLKLPRAYQALHKQMLQETKNMSLRSRHVLDIYVLETALFEKVLRGDHEGTSIELRNLSQMVNRSNAGDVVTNRAYFSHLWRQMDRYIFQVTGRRKTFPLKQSLDALLNVSQELEQMVGWMEEFILQSTTELALFEHSRSHKMIETVKEYVEMNLADDVSLESVAQRVGFSSYYLSKLFKKAEGTNFKDYVIKVKMEKAKILLAKGDMNIAEVSLKVGYPNANYFSKAFKQYFGMQPKEVRSH